MVMHESPRISNRDRFDQVSISRDLLRHEFGGSHSTSRFVDALRKLAKGLQSAKRLGSIETVDSMHKL